MRKLLFIALRTFCGVAQDQTTTHSPTDVFPGETWSKAKPEELGWSAEKLDQTRKFFGTLPPANLVVVDHGRVVVEWGDPAMKTLVSSVRKSILSVLYGIDLPGSKVDLDASVGQLSIDDDYNNWDFNALGTIFEQQFHTAIGREFLDKIALPAQMEDFRLENMYYKSARADDPDYVKSLHRAYLFRLSARDFRLSPRKRKKQQSGCFWRRGRPSGPRRQCYRACLSAAPMLPALSFTPSSTAAKCAIENSSSLLSMLY